MRKASIIAMAALTLLTAQCKKNEPKPEEKVMVPITGSVDFGGSKTEITTAGYITPVSGDKIYIYYEGGYAGYMTCTPTTGQQFTCSGEIYEECLGENCTFMYLGTGSTDFEGNEIDGTNDIISFADQTGVSVSGNKISGLEKFHVGSCQAQVSVDGKVTLNMATKMSIAYFQLMDEYGNAIESQDVTISGVSSSAIINMIDGTLEGEEGGTGDPGITVTTDSYGCFYMALIPQSDEVTFSFAVDGKIGSNVFPYGIRECSFYSEQGSGEPLQVTVETCRFSVDYGTEVQFSPGNLYWDGCDSKWKFSGRFDCAFGESFEDPGHNGWDPGYVSHFYWSQTESVAYAESYDDPGASDYDWFFTEDEENFRVWNQEGNCCTAGWHTPSRDEWHFLLGINPANPEDDNYGRTDAKAKRAFLYIDKNPGLVILPDNVDASVMENIDSELDLLKYGAVFLPAMGFREGSDVYEVLISEFAGYYWSRTPEDKGYAYQTDFYDIDQSVSRADMRERGRSVRLVRYLLGTTKCEGERNSEAVCP